MATTVNAAPSAIPSLTAEVTVALAEAGEVINRLALYDTAEAKGRHTDANLSILRYALERYVGSSIEVPSKYRVKVEATDESMIISGENRSPKRAKTDRFEQEIAYPLWLAAFFADDEHFDLLLPEDKTPLAEVIEILTDHVAAIAEEEDDEDDEEEDPDEDEDDKEEEEDAGYLDDIDEEDDDADEEDEEDPDDEGDAEADEEAQAQASTVDTCRADSDGECTNTLHALEGEHGRA